MKNISSFFKKKPIQPPRPEKATLLSSIGNDAFVDWSLIVASACVIAAVLIVIGGYLYIDTQSQLAQAGSVAPVTSAASRFDIKKLGQTIGVFDGRAAERVMLQKGYKGPTDPLLP